MEIFLGGTCNGSTWREDLIPLLKIQYFNPVVEDWTPECMEIERQKREECDYCLYVITPKMKGVFSIAEVVEDSIKRPEKTLFLVKEWDGIFGFEDHELKSLEQVKEMVRKNGGMVFSTLFGVADWVNQGHQPTLDMDLDAFAWCQIKEAAKEAKWMPKEYSMNDWVRDVVWFLKDKPFKTETDLAIEEFNKWIDEDLDYNPSAQCKRGTIYILGPMRGYKNHNLEAFYKAEEKLKKDGWVVINPAKNPPGMSIDAYVGIDIASVMASDAVYRLKGWEKSTGAKSENSVAEWRMIEILDEE